MSATGFTPILLYASGTATNVPSASNLTNSTNGAELAINYADGKLFYKDGSNAVQVIASKAAASGTFSSVTITGGTINGTSVGATTASTGAFTTLSASSTVSGTGFSTYLASPPAIGGTTPAAGSFTNLSSSGTVSGTGFSNYLASPPAIGGTTAAAVTGTTITATTQFSGPGTGLTGTASGLSIGGNAATATTATSATSATTATTATNVASGAANQIVYNTGAGATSFITAPTTSSTYLQWNGTSFVWAAAGGGTSVTVSNDTATSSNLYPLFATATSGTVSSVNTSNAKLLYKPSTGEFQASELVATNGIVVNSKTVAASYTIPTGYCASSVGPMTVASGQSVTVSSGSRWIVM